MTRNASFSTAIGVRAVSIAVVSAILLTAATGCQESGSSSPQVEAVVKVPSPDEIRHQLDEVLEFTYSHRHLNLKEHAAWQILHGALAYQRDFLVDQNGQRVSAVDHILGGGRMTGWSVEGVVNADTGHRGIRALLEVGSKTGQGHADQWFAVLAQCGLKPDQTLVVEGDTFTMQDFVAQVQLDVPRNVDREYSWTLIGLTTYLSTDTHWTASDGEQWSIERLLQIEAEQADSDLASGACGGTHRLIGLAMALNRHLDQGGPLEGAWELTDKVIQRAIESARAHQNPDGSFSTRYFEGPGSSPDLAQNLGTTGHVLEFLTLAMTDEQLEQPWVKRAAVNLCELFRKTRSVALECGALYHAAHGLVLYRERVYGPRSYAPRKKTQRTASAATVGLD